MSNFLNKFYLNIEEELENICFASSFNSHNLLEKIKNNKNNFQLRLEEQSFLKNSDIILSDIIFSRLENNDIFKLVGILNLFRSVQFSKCNFYLMELNLSNNIFFNECNFYSEWFLFDYNLFKSPDNRNKTIYQNCKFYKKVSNYNISDKIYFELNNAQFQDCKFLDDIEFHKTIFNGKIVINNSKEIKTFKLVDSIFKEKFEFKENKVKETIIENTNFEKLVDFFDTNFLKKFKIEKSIFSDFIGFEKSKFYTQVNFKYVTFMSFINFRNAEFKNGLDLSAINIKEDINFLNVEIDSKNTNRETFRLVKYSFDKIGNHIEANKFFVEEMKKYKDEISTKSWISNFQEKSIFWVNETFSKFGSDYILSILWIILFSEIYTIIKLFLCNHKKIIQQDDFFDWIIYLFNQMALNFYPFKKKILIANWEIVSVIYYLIISILIWMTIVAIKRNTKR